MIRINLLPHREARRKQAMQDFYVLLGAGAVLGAVIVLAIGAYNSRQIAVQNERNNFIKNENTVLDGKIKEIATLKQEIDALKARQQAVQDLQGDRNQPVYLMDALVKLTPPGVHLRSFKQDGQRVVINGLAQSNDTVSKLLTNLGNGSPWLEHAELIGIRATTMQSGARPGAAARKVSEFNVSVTIRRARDNEPDAEDAKGGKSDGKDGGKPARS
jgi:type IV pilus assembly protein PilN